MDACVISAGCEMRLSTPPRLSAREKMRTDSETIRAASREPRSNVIIPPNPDICRLARAWWGCEGSPG
jgi:hypothetical protein